MFVAGFIRARQQIANQLYFKRCVVRGLATRHNSDTQEKTPNHPNLTNTSIPDVYPEKKFNTVINFGKQGHQYVIERFGKLHRTNSPGLFTAIPLVEQIREIDQREQVYDVKRLNAFTDDNVRISAAAQVLFRIIDPIKACYSTSNLIAALMSKAQSSLRAVIGQFELDQLLGDRNTINSKVLQDLSSMAEHWGVEVTSFEVTDLTPDIEIQKAMELQSTAERNKRSAIITAEGQRQAAIYTAEGERQAAILRAEGKKAAAELEAAATEIAGKMLNTVPDRVMQYNLQMAHIEMVRTTLRNGEHSTIYVPRDLINSVPVVTELFQGVKKN